MAESFSYKITTESELFTFDFSQVLAPTETINSAGFNIIVMNGTDDNPNSMVVGTPVITQQKVSQRLVNGNSEVTYRLEMVIQTSLSNTYVGVGDLTVYDVTQV
jgi:hypothetical protein